MLRIFAGVAGALALLTLVALPGPAAAGAQPRADGIAAAADASEFSAQRRYYRGRYYRPYNRGYYRPYNRRYAYRPYYRGYNRPYYYGSYYAPYYRPYYYRPYYYGAPFPLFPFFGFGYRW